MAEEHKKYADFEELVFENRNKAYGAYDLRRSYSGLLTKSFFIGVAFFLAAIILPFVYMKATEGEEVKDEIGIGVNLEEEKLPEEKPKEEEEEIIEEVKKEEPLQSLQDVAPLTEPEPVATVQNVEIVPKENAKDNTPPPTNEEMKNKAIGTTNTEGAATTTNKPAYVPGVEGGQGTQAVKPDVPVTPKPVPDNTIHTAADKEPNFTNGGIEGLRKMVQSNFDTEAVEGEGILNTEVVFVVEPNGTISQVKATGKNSDFNREAERVIRSIRTKWEPAEKGGQKVRYRYRFPLKMRFE